MNKFRFLNILALALAAAALVFAAMDVHSQPSPTPGANIRLTPSSGFSSFTVEGSGFLGDGTVVTIEWDGEEISAFHEYYPYEIGDSTFTAIIDVPDDAEPGRHSVRASDRSGRIAAAIFTVVDMSGPEGPEGEAGPDGAPGLPGSPGSTGSPGSPGPEGNMGRQGEEANPGVDMTAIILALGTIALNLVLMVRRALK